MNLKLKLEVLEKYLKLIKEEYGRNFKLEIGQFFDGKEYYPGVHLVCDSNDEIERVFKRGIEVAIKDAVFDAYKKSYYYYEKQIDLIMSNLSNCYKTEYKEKKDYREVYWIISL